MKSPEFLADFQKEQRRLQQRIGAMETLFSQNGLARFLKEICELRDKLTANRFNLVVMGQFKRGKSTLINALLGRPLLPTAVVPLTSVVTVLHYGAEVRVSVHFLGSASRVISIEEIPQYITEKHNPKNEKQVDRVEIAYPAELLRDGVRLIDTPGVGSVFEHNTDVAYQFIPKADAVLFLITADPPISQAELQFLAHVREHAARIFFLKNKIDHLSPQDLEESLAFTRQVLAEHLQLPGERLTLLPLSAKWGLEARLQKRSDLLEKSGLQEMEQTLETFLMQEKGAILLKTTRKRLHQLLGEAITLLELEIKAIQTPLAQLVEKIEAFRREQTFIQQEKEDIEHLLQGSLRRIMASYDEEVRAFKQTQIPELQRWLQARFDAQRQAGIKTLTQILETELCHKIEEVFTPWRKLQEEAVDQQFSQLAARLSARANAVIDRIYETAGNLFELQMEKYETEEHLAAEEYFYFKVGGEISALEPFENLLTYGMAALISKKVLLNKTLSQLPLQFDKQCGRIRADLLERLRESGFRFSGRLRERIDQAFTEIDEVVQRAVQQHKANKQRVSSRTTDLQQLIGKLRQIYKIQT